MITLVLGELTKGDRKKLVTLITIDVHSRDVIGRIVDEKVDNSTSFQWVSQLRYYWDDKKGVQLILELGCHEVKLKGKNRREKSCLKSGGDVQVA